jgi:hypothetical protein
VRKQINKEKNYKWTRDDSSIIVLRDNHWTLENPLFTFWLCLKLGYSKFRSTSHRFHHWNVGQKLFKGYAMGAQWYRPKVLVILLHFFRSRGISSQEPCSEFSGIRSCYSAQAASTKRILENNDTISPQLSYTLRITTFWRVVFQPPTVGRIYVSWGMANGWRPVRDLHTTHGFF